MNVLVANSVAEWRAWLARHSATEREVWLVLRHQNSGTPGLRYPEAIEHALCFGWIDGLHRRRDATSSQLRFSPRTPRSSWSRVNRERAVRMAELGLMTEAGQAVVELAKANGTWEVVPGAEAGAVPADLGALLDRDAAARRHFDAFPPSSRRLILEWIAAAKRPETRQRRIARTAELAARNVRANHPGVRMRDPG
ncbi:uncharacterized protein YdeI (YjbR/CyaY-like superfamily) [Prauserella shujinwangii]|uniref:Uncharacterized protein YdeI (YjbR/CyaY-like superfamily) n=1 Tax=Prauserella shujinwangii TaxID=1453103 RepID=A0A2T0LP83_9PSEU|nr:YdeI/OmpD-associated family protein [Prauserella shujinwangii]PRX45014.1 uncharacterized protein YdeI (YjbR/CyaY-like superfamily) [Prauserella shujinwangii]